MTQQLQKNRLIAENYSESTAITPSRKILANNSKSSQLQSDTLELSLYQKHQKRIFQNCFGNLEL